MLLFFQPFILSLAAAEIAVYFYGKEPLEDKYQLALFVIGGFLLALLALLYKALGQLKNPPPTFLITKHGFCLNFLYNIKKAYFLPWKELRGIEKTRLKYETKDTDGDVQLYDADSLKLDISEQRSEELREHFRMQSVIGMRFYEDNCYLTPNAFDVELDEALSIIEKYRPH